MMIEGRDLDVNDVGALVMYTPGHGESQIGRIKSWNTNFVFVVYHCDDDWDDFKHYTACATNPDDLTFTTSHVEKIGMKEE